MPLWRVPCGGDLSIHSRTDSINKRLDNALEALNFWAKGAPLPMEGPEPELEWTCLDCKMVNTMYIKQCVCGALKSERDRVRLSVLRHRTIGTV